MIYKRFSSKVFSAFLVFGFWTSLSFSSDDYWNPEKYHLHSSSQQEAASDLLKNISFNLSDSVLDIGCGDGKITANIAEQVKEGKVIGLDASGAMIYFAKKVFPNTKYPNLSFISKKAEEMEYENTFDKVLSFTTLQWASDQKLIIENVKKSLKVGGFFALTMPMGLPESLQIATEELIKDPDWSSFFENFSTGWNFYEKAAYVDLLTQEGFSIKIAQVVRQEDVFPDLIAFYGFISNWFPYLRVLPNEKKVEFMNLVIQKYVELNPLDDQGRLHFRINRLEVIAEL